MHLWVILPRISSSSKRVIEALIVRAKTHGHLRYLTELHFLFGDAITDCADNALLSVVPNCTFNIVIAYHTHITKTAPRPAGVLFHILLNPERVYNVIGQRSHIAMCGSVIPKADLCDLCAVLGLEDGAHALTLFPGVRTDSVSPSVMDRELAWATVLEETTLSSLASVKPSVVTTAVRSKVPAARTRLKFTTDQLLTHATTVDWTQPADEASVSSYCSFVEEPPTDGNGERTRKDPRSARVLLVPLTSAGQVANRVTLLRILRYSTTHVDPSTIPLFCGVVYKGASGELDLQLAYYSVDPPTKPRSILMGGPPMEEVELLPPPWRFSATRENNHVFEPVPLSAAPLDVTESVLAAYSTAEAEEAAEAATIAAEAAAEAAANAATPSS